MMLGSGCSVLLVEDSPTDVDFTRRALARSGRRLSLEVARDGEEALAYLPQWELGKPFPHFILLDLKLPRIDGLEVLRQVKAHPRFRAVPVIVLTSSSEDADIKAAYALGANSYVVKPIDFERFLAVIGQIGAYWCGVNTSAN